MQHNLVFISIRDYLDIPEIIFAKSKY